ncbi:hypothetical protein PhaeoP97_03018 [Phaeobacter porticola]|uniref:Uncharacterized protein n=1 Tax=Phaeobacter porticola TaxID=1844006 RepID=A0A1L3I8K2_9RHOB|nr:hypothetical protein PhaeoP97_03018 [Phaeobacter porticola]
MEYSANATVKQAMLRAHEERGQVLRAIWASIFVSRRAKILRTEISRWA